MATRVIIENIEFTAGYRELGCNVYIASGTRSCRCAERRRRRRQQSLLLFFLSEKIFSAKSKTV